MSLGSCFLEIPSLVTSRQPEDCLEFGNRPTPISAAHPPSTTPSPLPPVQSILEMSEHNAAGGPADNAPQAPEEKPEVKPDSLEIKIKDQSENETIFKIKKHTKFGKVFDAYCQRQGLARNTVRFLLDGTRIQDHDTPESLDIEDGDMIDAMLEQLGGAAEGEGDSAGQAKPEATKISVRVKDVNGQEVEFKCKPTTVLKKLMDAFCQQQGRKPDTVRFFTPDGKRVTNVDTPASLGLDDGDLLDVLEEQQGGGI
ncbi:hypothetical protein VTL71DRAFT_3246 [Oculimacula yallundae]|uniref:Ubiquitin-like domain-containing protein n=1 Tax=Oculimacula yallundae TaxID=86028 RepID=A0ABR4C6L3_9HELO